MLLQNIPCSRRLYYYLYNCHSNRLSQIQDQEVVRPKDGWTTATDGHLYGVKNTYIHYW